MTEKFLDRAYGTNAPDTVRDFYDDWAASYDAEVAENGYVTPRRVAAALASYVRADAPLLDYGCGTGLSGLALRAAGFTVVDGLDPSGEMLTIARQKNIYRDLGRVDLDAPAPIPADTYDAIACIGVISTGAAPPDTLHMVMTALRKGGHLGLSFNDHALADPAYEAALCQWLDTGAACLLFKEYGDHLPGQDLKSNVYIVEKM
ncbi:MAG: class I SAM-dependent methyltransferase [Pseudomonadota bacterium]